MCARTDDDVFNLFWNAYSSPVHLVHQVTPVNENKDKLSFDKQKEREKEKKELQKEYKKQPIKLSHFKHHNQSNQEASLPQNKKYNYNRRGDNKNNYNNKRDRIKCIGDSYVRGSVNCDIKTINDKPAQKKVFKKSCTFIMRGMICPMGSRCNFEHGLCKNWIREIHLLDK